MCNFRKSAVLTSDNFVSELLDMQLNDHKKGVKFGGTEVKLLESQHPGQQFASVM